MPPSQVDPISWPTQRFARIIRFMNFAMCVEGMNVSRSQNPGAKLNLVTFAMDTVKKAFASANTDRPLNSVLLLLNPSQSPSKC